MASVSKQQRESREAIARLKRYEARQQLNATQRRRRVRDNIVAVAGVAVVVGLAAVTQVFYFTSGPGAPTPSPSETPIAEPDANGNVGAPDAALSEDRVWTGEFTFNDAVVGVALDGALAPQAVAGFVQDLSTNYYPGKTCHRLAGDGSFLQCGSIDGVGGADPAYSFGPVENAPADDLYPAGSIAMARSSDPYSNGHQFFIVLTDTTLDGSTGGYSIVGTVTSGLDALKALVAVGIDPETVGADGSGYPATDIVITNFTLQ